MPSDVIVVGAGIAGLTAAYDLHRQGLSVVVLERAARAGGVILSEEIDGYVVDAGPDSLLIQKPEGIALCQELGLGDRLVSTNPPRLAYIQRGGKLHALPANSVLGIPTRAGPFVRTRLFSWTGKLRMAAEIVVPRKRDDEDESIGDFITRRFGREATMYLAEPLLAGIHAGDVNRLSLRALFPRFADAERRHGSLIRAFRQTAARGPSAEGAFKSLPGGLSELVRALVAALPNGVVQTGAAVERIEGRSPFRIVASSGATYEAPALVLAVPAYATASLLRDRDAEISRLSGEVPYSSIATVALAYPRESIAHPLNGSGYVVPRVERIGILAATWLSSKWPHRAPPGRVLLRTFVGGARNPDAFGESDAALIARSLAAIGPVLGVRGDPLWSRVYRFERANAQHEVGHHARMMAIERALAAHPGLFLTGSGFRGVGIPDCVADARATATQVAGWLAKAGEASRVEANRRRS